jgi:HK97 family phage portal protein
VTIDQARELKDDLKKGNRGIQNMHMPTVLSGGAHFVPAMITAEQTQFIQLRQFSVEEIARFFRVPPYLIGDLAKTTSYGSGVEQMGIGFVAYTLRPWIERIEEAWSRRMLFMRPGVRAGFDVAGLLRGDQVARADYYQKQFMVAAMSPNDIAKAEGRKPVPDGDIRYYPVSMAPVGTEPIKIAKVMAEEPDLTKSIADDASPVAADLKAGAKP